MFESKFYFYYLYERTFHNTAFILASKEFEDAKTKLGVLKEDPGNEAKLKLYGLFKQVIYYLE